MVTLKVSVVSVILSTILGIILGIIMTSKNKVIKFITTLYLESIRIIPLNGLALHILLWSTKYL